MALITCPECGKQISDRSSACIGCGIPMEEIKKLLSENELLESTKEISIKSTGIPVNSIFMMDKPVAGSKTFKCIVCGKNLGLSGVLCPECSYPMLSLSMKPDYNRIEVYRADMKKERGSVDLKKPLLNRGYTKVEIDALGQSIPQKYLLQLFLEYEHFAQSGNTNAQNNLGELYLWGYGVEKDYSKALEWFEKAAEQGNASAQNRIGFIYREGYGVEKDYSKALEWYQKAAEQGNASAQNNIGFIYLEGYGVEKDYSKALEWYQKAAEQGNASAQYSIGFMYSHGYGVEKDYSKALEWYQKAAEQGNASAQYSIGYMYHSGDGVEEDYHEAMEWYQKAAEQGNALAQYYIGEIYFCIEEDYTKAMEWYQKAAEQGNADAMDRIGEMYHSGDGVEQDLKIALEWYIKAAEQGTAISLKYAQDILESMFKSDTEVVGDNSKTLEWILKAAEQGCSSAQNSLGFMYRYGYGVEKDYTKAMEWFEKSHNENSRSYREENKYGELYRKRIIKMSEKINKDWDSSGSLASIWSKPPRANKRVEFGKYVWDPSGNKMPIKWIVLEENDQKQLLLSESILDQDKNIVSWLSRFEKEAFTETERNRILYTYYDNAIALETVPEKSTDLLNKVNQGAYQELRELTFVSCYDYYLMNYPEEKISLMPDSLYRQYVGTTHARTIDKRFAIDAICNDIFTCSKVFMLSTFEVEYYFPKLTNRMTKLSPYAQKKDNTKKNKSREWWLRGYCHVCNTGVAVKNDYTDDKGMRPAIWIKKH